MRLTKKLNIVKFLSLPMFLVSLFSCNSNKSVDKTKIYFWHTFGQNVVEELSNKVEDFEKLIKENEGIDISIELTYQGSYDDMLNQVNKGLAIGNTPTICVAYPDHVADYLSHESFDEEYVYNLENLMHDSKIGYGMNSYLGDDKDETDIVNAFFAESKAYLKEGIYSIPFMKSSEVLMYNKDIVDTKLLKAYDSTISNYDEYMANLTWDQFVDLLRFVKEDMNNGGKICGNNLEVPLIYDSDENLYISKSMQNNIPFISIKDGKGSLDFDNDEAKEMVKTLKGYYDEGLLKTKGSNNNEYGSYSFTEGRCLFAVGSSGGAGYNDPGEASFKVGVVKVPYDNNNPLYVSQGPTLTLLKSKGVSDEVNEFRKEYAWKFVKYITNTENNADMCYLGSEGYIPIRNSSYTSGYYKEYLEDADTFLAKTSKVVVEDINGRYLSTPAFKGSSAARDQVGAILANVFLDKYDVDKAFSEAKQLASLSM